MPQRSSSLEIPGYYRLILIAGLIAVLVALHLSEKEKA
jgi:hypothetical protein